MSNLPPKRIWLLEMDKDEWTWCDDPQPDSCLERKIVEYIRADQYAIKQPNSSRDSNDIKA